LKDVEPFTGAGTAMSSSQKGSAAGCGYSNFSQNPSSHASVVVMAPFEGSGYLQNRRQQVKAAKDLSGFGPGAFYVVEDDEAHVHFGKNGMYVEVDVRVKGKPDVAAAQKLATIVLGRLP
jgi:hypothetical protein